MVNEYIKNEIQKIMSNKEYGFPLNQALSATCVLANLKGINLKLFDLQGGSALCDYVILASSTNATQSRSMADETSSQLKAIGAQVYSYEGYDQADWILLDFGDFMVHIFQESSRDIYDLDKVFSKYKPVKIPEEFYFGSGAKTTNDQKVDAKNYF